MKQMGHRLARALFVPTPPPLLLHEKTDYMAPVQLLSRIESRNNVNICQQFLPAPGWHPRCAQQCFGASTARLAPSPRSRCDWITLPKVSWTTGTPERQTTARHVGQTDASAVAAPAGGHDYRGTDTVKRRFRAETPPETGPHQARAGTLTDACSQLQHGRGAAAVVRARRGDGESRATVGVSGRSDIIAVFKIADDPAVDHMRLFTISNQSLGHRMMLSKIDSF